MTTINSAALALVQSATGGANDLESLYQARAALEDGEYLAGYFGGPVDYDDEDEEKTARETEITERAYDIVEEKIKALEAN